MGSNLNPVLTRIKTRIRWAETWEEGRVINLLNRCVRRETGYTVDSVMQELRNKTAQLWVIGDYTAIVVTKLVNRPLFRCLEVPWLAGSNSPDWLGDFKSVAKEFAKTEGCSAIEVFCRPGWDRHAKEQLKGFKLHTNFYRMDI